MLITALAKLFRTTPERVENLILAFCLGALAGMSFMNWACHTVLH